MKPIRLLILLAWGLALPLQATTYYTAVDGDDAHPGTAEWPWRTIQKAAITLHPGDTVIVREGIYDERITTLRGGTNEASRITFQAEGTVTMRGWRIYHPYITVNGFKVTGHWSTSSAEGYVRVSAAGNHFTLLNCTIHDGIKLASDEVVFQAPNIIQVASGGFLAAGFAPNQTISAARASPAVLLNASKAWVIASVTDTQLTVNGAGIVNEGPVPAYIAAASPYGLHLASGVEHCVIRGNTFRNLAYDAWFIMGTGHRLEHNLIEQVNGWDAMHFGGANHVFYRNVIRDSPLVVYQVSPDAMENYSPTPYFNVLFTNNFICNFAGVLASQKSQNTMSGLTLTRNVFVDVEGGYGLTHPDAVIEHNTFVRVAKTNNPVISVAKHPLKVHTSVGATNITIRNNLFVDCGQATSRTKPEEVGWYEISGSADTVVAEGNFVAGGPPDYGAKVGWLEGNALLNGGDPGFVNSNDPLGPDGLPFTDDDGLRLLSTSKLVGAGAGGRTIGAYDQPVAGPPQLIVQVTPPHQLRLTWPQTDETWTLESAPTVAGPWDVVSSPPVLMNGQFQVIVGITHPAAFYRLQFTSSSVDE